MFYNISVSYIRSLSMLDYVKEERSVSRVAALLASGDSADGSEEGAAACDLESEQEAQRCTDWEGAAGAALVSLWDAPLGSAELILYLLQVERCLAYARGPRQGEALKQRLRDEVERLRAQLA